MQINPLLYILWNIFTWQRPFLHCLSYFWNFRVNLNLLRPKQKIWKLQFISFFCSKYYHTYIEKFFAIWIDAILNYIVFKYPKWIKECPKHFNMWKVHEIARRTTGECPHLSLKTRFNIFFTKYVKIYQKLRTASIKIAKKYALIYVCVTVGPY